MFKVIDAKFENINLSEECRNDILNLCDQLKHNTNFEVLLCLQRSEKVIEAVSQTCQHYLWQFKNNYVNGLYFNRISNNSCKAEMSKFGKCLSIENDDQVICLIKHNSEITNKNCLRHVKDAMQIIFSDIFLVSKFLNHCVGDIQHFKCGRLQGKIASVKIITVNITSQTFTLNCLIKSFDRLQSPCRRQILRLAEIQSDDFHYNPTLFYACREDREIFCANINSGNSQIYRCLEEFKTNNKMSRPCRDEINKKQKLESYDFKIRKYFTEKCSKDISSHKCTSSVGDNTDASILTIILCLLQVDAEYSTIKLDPHCRAEVLLVREQLSKNTEMSIEVNRNCKKEIKMYCSDINKTIDDVIHCLLRNTNPTQERSFSNNCMKALRTHFKVVNPTENIGLLDPFVSKACSNELKTKCTTNKIKQPEDIYECLLQQIDVEEDSILIHDDCKSVLLTLAYFIEKDYSLNHKLYKNCHKDALKLCGIKTKRGKEKNTLVKNVILQCLVQRWNSEEHNLLLSTECDNEIQNIMKIEANNIKLNYQVYSSCFKDIIKFCKEKTHTLDCLQFNYQKLQDICKNSISDFLRMDKADYSIKQLIRRSCGPMIRLFCQNEINSHEKNFINCLVRYKHHKNMDKFCKISIEHYQIIGLDNYKINHKFAHFCSKEIIQYCGNHLPEINSISSNMSDMEDQLKSSMRIEKSVILSCLSKKLTINLLQNQNPFSSKCYEQFTFEFLQLGDSLGLDREIQKSCVRDITEWCSKFKGDQVIYCLQKNEGSLSDKCYGVLASRQQLSALDNQLDQELQRDCQEMISTYCNNQLKSNVFRCLHVNLRRDVFNKQCKAKVLYRLERRLADIRLNPKLIKTCKQEMIVLCNATGLDDNLISILNRRKMDIVNCLRVTFVKNKKLLRTDCQRLIFEIVMDAHANYHLDPSLYDHCKLDVKQLCFKYMENNDLDTDGRVQDCLKHNLLKGKILNKRCSYEIHRLLSEEKADVHLDIQLYNACSEEISRICYTEQFGAGKKLNCLLWAIDDTRGSLLLSKACKIVLNERKQMWALAGKMDAPENVQQMLALVSESESRYYLLVVFLMILTTVLTIGVIFGRLTKGKKIIRKRR